VAAGKHPPAWTRLLRRLARPFLSSAEKERIVSAIAEAESRTTGEIHVHVIARSGGKEMLTLAKETFDRLGLRKTDARNGVLILISHLDHRFAIWGDEGIHAKAGQRLWEDAAKVLRERFAERLYPEGVEACVRAVAEELARHFPKTEPGPGKNQLPNDVTES